jgi:hypothetical protein
VRLLQVLSLKRKDFGAAEACFGAAEALTPGRCDLAYWRGQMHVAKAEALSGAAHYTHCVCTRTHARPHIQAHACAHARTHIQAHACAHARTHIQAHACTHARTYIQAHACTHARTPAQRRIDRRMRTHAHATQVGVE